MSRRKFSEVVKSLDRRDITKGQYPRDLVQLPNNVEEMGAGPVESGRYGVVEKWGPEN